MHIQRSPGESVEVDWAGDAMSFADPVSGEAIDAWLFVAAFSFSAYVYVEAFTDMRLPAWIDAHVHAFEAFGGAGRLLVPDNLRTGVSRSDRYEPALNPAYARLAEHYGTAIVPARVRRPRDKPVVEGSVRFVANQVAAVLRNRHFVGLAELNEAIFDEVAEINAIIANLNDGNTVFYKDIGKEFLDQNGGLSGDIMPDYLHLSAKGYDIWGKAIKADMERLVR